MHENNASVSNHGTEFLFAPKDQISNVDYAFIKYSKYDS